MTVTGSKQLTGYATYFQLTATYATPNCVMVNQTGTSVQIFANVPMSIQPGSSLTINTGWQVQALLDGGALLLTGPFPYVQTTVFDSTFINFPINIMVGNPTQNTINFNLGSQVANLTYINQYPGNGTINGTPAPLPNQTL